MRRRRTGREVAVSLHEQRRAQRIHKHTLGSPRRAKAVGEAEAVRLGGHNGRGHDPPERRRGGGGGHGRCEVDLLVRGGGVADGGGGGVAVASSVEK